MLDGGLYKGGNIVMYRRKSMSKWFVKAIVVVALSGFGDPGAIWADSVLSETEIIDRFEGKKIVANVKHKEHENIMLKASTQLYFSLYPDRSMQWVRYAPGKGGVLSRSGKWWTKTEKGKGRLCVQIDGKDGKCFKIVIAGENYKFFRKKKLAFMSDSVESL